MTYEEEIEMGVDESIIRPRKTRKNTRAVKEQSGNVPAPNPKFANEKEARLNDFVPTPAQWEFVDKIRNNKIIFIESVAGVGKSSVALWAFCKEYVKDTSSKIMVLRTPVDLGTDQLGYLVGDKQMKCAVHFESTRSILNQFLGKGKVDDDIAKGRIILDVPNFQLGKTWDSCYVLIDEVQQMSPLIIKLLLERIGKNTTVVVAGANDQLYSTDKKRNGLKDAISRFFYEEDGRMVSKFKGEPIAYHSFGIDCVMRDDIVKTVLKAYAGIDKEK